MTVGADKDAQPAEDGGAGPELPGEQRSEPEAKLEMQNRELREAQHRLRLLATVSEMLTSSFDYSTNLAQVARLSVPQFADICILDLQEENRRIRRLEVAVADVEHAGWAEALRRRCLTPDSRAAQLEVLRSGQPVYAPSGLPTLVALGVPGRVRVNSLILVPLLSGGRVLGVFTFAMANSLRTYVRTDLTFSQELASRAAMAIENARLYEEAQRTIRARQDILSVVCHDLRNPLSIVQLGCKSLVDSSPKPDRRTTSRRQLELMLRAAEQMNRMITDLLDVSSIEAGHLAIELAEHSLEKLVQDAFEMLSPFTEQERLELRVDVPSETLVRCDRERVLQVFANLGGNAVKFAPEGTAITLGADILNGVVRFSVADRGPGIAPEAIGRLFDRYWQDSKTAKKGRGLGLFISKGLVEAQGGKIWVESNLGGGTTFFFTLPLGGAIFESACEAARRAQKNA